MSAQSQVIARGGLQDGNVRALALLGLFVVLQVADACLTTIGVGRFGLAAEANPIVALPMAVFGPVAALAVAKAASIGAASVLYRFSRHTLLAVLTVAYLFVAIAPWAWALAVTA
jgi:hypothetical protein